MAMASLATPMGAGPSWPHTNPPNLGVGHRSFHYGSWKLKVKTLQQNSSSTVDLLAHCLDIRISNVHRSTWGAPNSLSKGTTLQRNARTTRLWVSWARVVAARKLPAWRSSGRSSPATHRKTWINFFRCCVVTSIPKTISTCLLTF